jgi:uncharacterized membrane protein YphA (DoxX/SURF4 family)
MDRELVDAVVLGCRFILGALFLTAGVSKIVKPGAMVEILARLIPGASRQVSLSIGYGVASAECIVGVALITGIGVGTAAATAIVTLLMFSGVLLVLIRMDYEGSCACFPLMQTDEVSSLDVTRNVVLMFMAFAVWQSAALGAPVASPVWTVDGFALLTAAATAVAFGLCAGVALELLRWHRLSRLRGGA